MTGVVTLVLLVASLALAAVAGPRLVGAAAPVLVRAPRAAVLLLTALLGLWVLGAAAVALVLAWVATGPSLLPGGYGEVCQRCVDAANPFTGVGAFDSVVPITWLGVAAPLAVLGFVAAVGLRWTHQARARRAVHRDIRRAAAPAVVDGHPVLRLDDDRSIVFSVPARRGGVVVARGIERCLNPAQLRAVLAHERAHVQQRHHALLAVVDAVVFPLRRIPLARTVADAVPHYLEIAADAAARRETGAAALASALLELGAPTNAPREDVAGAVLHAAGPNRVRHLVAPRPMRPALLPVTALGSLAAAFAVTSVAAHAPLVHAILSGCRLPG